MLSFNKFSILMVMILVISVSCGSRRTFETQSPTQSLASYTLLEIPDFHSAVEKVPPDLLWNLPNQIEKELRADPTTFAGVSRAPLDVKEGVLILDGTVTKVSPKEWYKQIVKSGKVVVKVRLIDKEESLVIAEAYFEGTAKWGILGGGMVFADIRLVHEIVDYLKQDHPKLDKS